MALMERFFPVTRQSHNFFDQFMAQMNREFQEMELEMQRMRQRMFHLVPMERSKEAMDVKDIAIHPKLPIVEERGQSKLKLEFNVQDFKPEEVVVKVVGNNILQVEAKHEVHSETSDEVRTYFRQYQLPTTIDSSTIKPSLTKDGVLTIEAPAPPLGPQEKILSVEYKK